MIDWLLVAGLGFLVNLAVEVRREHAGRVTSWPRVFTYTAATCAVYGVMRLVGVVPTLFLVGGIFVLSMVCLGVIAAVINAINDDERFDP